MSDRLRHLLLKHPLAPVVAAVVVAALLFLTRDKPQAEPLPESIVNVRVAVAEVADRSPIISLYGRMEARQSSALTAAINADVQEIRVAPGQMVVKDQLLVLLDDREAALALKQAQAELQLIASQGRTDESALESERRALTLSQNDAKRFEDLKKRGLSSQSALDGAKRGLETQGLAFAQRQLAVNQFAARKAQAQVQLDRAQLDLDRTRIAAPYDGLVTEVSISVGDRVSPGQAIISLYDPNSLEVRATIPDRYLPEVQQGLETGELEAQLFAAGDTFSAHLIRLAANRMAGNGGTDAYFRIDQSAQAALVPGRSLALRLALPKIPATVVVPFEAVYGLDTVYTVRDERLAPIAIQRFGSFYPPEQDAHLLIGSAQLQSGDRILVTQLPTAARGTHVRIVEEDGGGAAFAPTTPTTLQDTDIQ